MPILRKTNTNVLILAIAALCVCCPKAGLAEDKNRGFTAGPLSVVETLVEVKAKKPAAVHPSAEKEALPDPDPEKSEKNTGENASPAADHHE